MAVEWARRLETERNLFVVMRICSPVVLSYLDAGVEPQYRRKDFWTACLRLLLLATVRRIVLKHGSKRPHFHLKMDHRLEPRHGTSLIEHPFAII